jgi:4-hydroxybenzoate polyprenyltransferase
VRLLRPVHWVKNGFVLAPLLFTFRELDLPAIVRAGLAALAFCLASSLVYIVNDLADRESDRRNPEKQHRPLASGAVTAPVALALASGCALGAAAICAFLPWHVGVLTAGYVLLNAAYTWALKRVVIIDVMAIAAGFILRVFAGAAAIDLPVSPWMTFTTFFLSLFLGFSKRRSELVTVAPSRRRRVLLDYSESFLNLMVTMSVTLTIITYSLYVFTPGAGEAGRVAGLIYTVPIVVYGLLRYLYLVVRRKKGGDVAEVVMRDPPLIVTIVLWAGVAGVLVALRP